MDLKGKKGITIMTLTVTIIILLILAGISISMLTGENGLIKNAGNAKEQAEIDGEKEIIEISTIQAMGKNKYGNVTQKELEEKLNNNAGNGKTEVLDSGDTLVVKFTETERYYEVDKNGNISEPITMTKDEYAGDLTKGGACDGSESNPFQISCIEDLVTFSMKVNGGNSELGISSSNFNGKYVILTRTLDFKSIFSYNDFTTTKYGDLNTDGVVEDIKTELTKNDEGCIGFTPIGVVDIGYNSGFWGIFDGKNNEILNIYVNYSGNAGLFGKISKNEYRATIKNIGISGKITGTGYTGGIVGITGGEHVIENCWNKAEISGGGETGGICGYSLFNGSSQIKNCYNEGKITGYRDTGGIVGRGTGKLIILNCYNEGEIISTDWFAGGIIGNIHSAAYFTPLIKVYNSYNLGDVKAKSTWLSYVTARGIGYVGDDGIIKNCYNVGGAISFAYSTNKHYVIGTGTTGNDENCYYLSGLETYANSGIDTNATAFTKQDSDTVVEKLNLYIDNHKGDETLDTSEWKYWKVGENGYPTFE